MSRGKFSWPRKGYKYQMDESYKHEVYPGKEKDKVWYQQIPLKCGGFISLYSLYQDDGGPVLKAWTPKQRKTFRAVYDDLKSKGVGFDDHFDGWEAELYFTPDLLPIVAERIGARKRRQMSPEAKEKAIERLKKFRFERTKDESQIAG